MSDARQRPQYGEYASPDERIAAGGLPLEPEVVAAAPVAASTELPPPDAASRVDGAPPVARNGDAMLTIALLVFGVYSVVSSIPGLLGLSTTLVDAFTAAKIGTYTSFATADAIGVAILVCHSVILVAVVALSLARVRARRLAFFIPLAGGALAGVIYIVLLLVAMASDPSFAAWVDSRS
jgi:hypothetical protein